MLDTVAICNLALGKIGQGAIVSLSDDSELSRKCSQFFHSSKEIVLSAREWSFATKQQRLSLLDKEVTGYTYVYAIPSDALRLISLMDDGTFTITDYDLLTIDNQRIIANNSESCVLTYVSKNHAPLPMYFANALSDYLAYILCNVLLGDTNKANTQYNLYLASLSEATRQDFQGKRKPFISNPIIDSRDSLYDQYLSTDIFGR